MTVSALTEASSGIGSPVGSVVGLVVALLFAFGCYKLAQSKGRGPVLWAILGFFFTLLTLIILLIIPRRRYIVGRGFINTDGTVWPHSARRVRLQSLSRLASKGDDQCPLLRRAG